MLIQNDAGTLLPASCPTVCFTSVPLKGMTKKVLPQNVVSHTKMAQPPKKLMAFPQKRSKNSVLQRHCPKAHLTCSSCLRQPRGPLQLFGSHHGKDAWQPLCGESGVPAIPPSAGNHSPLLKKSGGLMRPSPGR